MSQAQEILNLLSDGRGWSTAEIMREVPSIVHSRINDLRDKGHIITHRTSGQGARHSWYRLIVPLEEPELGKQAHVSRRAPQGLGRFEVGATRKDAPGPGSSSGSNLGLSSGSPDTPQPLDGPLVLEGQETLL